MQHGRQKDRLTDYLVAHRGDRAGGVENTLNGFAAAVAAGARYAECDIQFSCDLVPLVVHDNSLKRLCGRPDIKVTDTSADDLRKICQPHFLLSTLPELLAWLKTEPALTVFVEIKPPIRRRLTDRSIARRIGQCLPADLLPRLVIISQSAGLIDAFAGEIACPVGWVAEGARRPEHAMQYVFMPWQRADEMERWQAQGARVGLYTVNDAAQAVALRQAGADLVETNYFSKMIRDIG